MFLLVYSFSNLYQIARLGDDDDEPRFSSASPLEEGTTFFFSPRPLKNLVMVDEMDSLSPITSCQVGCVTLYMANKMPAWLNQTFKKSLNFKPVFCQITLLASHCLPTPKSAELLKPRVTWPVKVRSMRLRNRNAWSSFS